MWSKGEFQELSDSLIEKNDLGRLETFSRLLLVPDWKSTKKIDRAIKGRRVYFKKQFFYPKRIQRTYFFILMRYMSNNIFSKNKQTGRKNHKDFC